MRRLDCLLLCLYQVQLRNWNISASRLPPQSGYEELPAVANAGVDVDAFPAGPGRLMTGTQVYALLLVWSPNDFAAFCTLQLTGLGRPQVTPHLDPRAMYQLARLCKPMRTALMKKANRHVWKAMFRKQPTFPPCPKHLIEPQYVTLLCGNECNVSPRPTSELTSVRVMTMTLSLFYTGLRRHLSHTIRRYRTERSCNAC